MLTAGPMGYMSPWQLKSTHLHANICFVRSTTRDRKRVISFWFPLYGSTVHAAAVVISRESIAQHVAVSRVYKLRRCCNDWVLPNADNYGRHDGESGSGVVVCVGAGPQLVWERTQPPPGHPLDKRQLVPFPLPRRCAAVCTCLLMLYMLVVDVVRAC